jgi:hypothetical protein
VGGLCFVPKNRFLGDRHFPECWRVNLCSANRFLHDVVVYAASPALLLAGKKLCWLVFVVFLSFSPFVLFLQYKTTKSNFTETLNLSTLCLVSGYLASSSSFSEGYGNYSAPMHVVCYVVASVCGFALLMILLWPQFKKIKDVIAGKLTKKKKKIEDVVADTPTTDPRITSEVEMKSDTNPTATEVSSPSSTTANSQSVPSTHGGDVAIELSNLQLDRLSLTLDSSNPTTTATTASV